MSELDRSRRTSMLSARILPEPDKSEVSFWRVGVRRAHANGAGRPSLLGGAPPERNQDYDDIWKLPTPPRGWSTPTSFG